MLILLYLKEKKDQIIFNIIICVNELLFNLFYSFKMRRSLKVEYFSN